MSSEPSKGQFIGQIVVDAVSTALPIVGPVLSLLGLATKGPDEKAKKKNIEAAIQQERAARLAEAQIRLKPMLTVSVELATLNAFLKPAIYGQERVREMLGILLLTETPSESTWTTVKNKWEQVSPLLAEFNKVPDSDISKVRDLMLRMNLFDLKGINVATGIEISQTIAARDIPKLRDGLKDLARALQLLFKATSVEISNLQGEIEVVSSFISPQPTPANDLALFAPADDFAKSALAELNEEVLSLRNKYVTPDGSDWCFAWFGELQLSEGMKDLGALQKDAAWTRGEEITISFLEGDEALHQRVRQVAKEWTGPNMANLALSFRKNTNATDIRISFDSRGSWSMIGKTCRTNTDLSKPTMNLSGLTADSPEQQLRRTVLHEFGHALGLLHEHQIPTGGLQWNRDAVIRDLSGPPNEWSLKKIEDNIFKPYGDGVVSTALDVNSIMIYPIPSTWTLNGQSVRFNTELSETDKKFIREQYPNP